MTTSRPRIPAEIEREVLAHSGHRCAVCGDPCPLERAHIIPWCKSKSHDSENLICLCANCHQRADNEKWGEKTLRLYKERPWIERKQAADHCGPKRQIVTFRAELDFSAMTEKERRILLYALAGFLEISPEDIEITEIEPGSIIVTVDLPDTAAERLHRAISSQDPKFVRLMADFASGQLTVPKSDDDELHVELRHLLEEGRGLLQDGAYSNAEVILRKAYGIAETLKDIQTQANLCCNIGIIREKLGDLNGALSLHSDALILDQQTGYEHGIANHYLNLGRVRYELGDVPIALEMLRQAKSRFEKLNMSDKAKRVERLIAKCKLG